MSYHKPCENQVSVGIDLGIKHFAILSDGSYKFAKKYEYMSKTI